MESKLYVGNLAYTTTEDQLSELFSQAGTVKSAAIIRDRDSGRSKGFGFVEMETAEDAQKAITMFNGANFLNRPLTVNIARPREERPAGGGFGGPRGGFGGGGERRGGPGGDRRGPRSGGGQSRGGGPRDY